MAITTVSNVAMKMATKTFAMRKTHSIVLSMTITIVTYVAMELVITAAAVMTEEMIGNNI